MSKTPLDEMSKIGEEYLNNSLELSRIIHKESMKPIFIKPPEGVEQEWKNVNICHIIHVVKMDGAPQINFRHFI